MKKHAILFALIAGLALAATAVHAQTKASVPQPSPAAAKAAVPKRLVVRGEIVDMGCYLARGLRGPLHTDCARQCLAVGVPMGLLGPDSTVYLLTQDHGRAMAPSQYQTPDAYAQCKDWASMTVEVMGTLYVRNGVNVLEVSRAKVVPADAAAAGRDAGGAAKKP